MKLRLAEGHIRVGAHGMWWLGAVLSLVGLLAGCDSTPEDQAAAAAAQAAGGPKPPPPGAEMVNAVSSGKGSSLVNVKFELEGRPVVGEPLEIRLMLIAEEDLEKVFARFQGTDALELVGGEQTLTIDKPRAGGGIPHTVKVVPREEGVSYMTATLVADTLTQSTARLYSIPVITGTPVAEPAAAAPSATESTAAAEAVE